jgi:hypothetical protein
LALRKGFATPVHRLSTPRRSQAAKGFGRKQIFFDRISGRFPFVLSVKCRAMAATTERSDAGI